MRLTRTQGAQARRGKGQPRSGDWTLTFPFPALKKKNHLQGWFSFFYRNLDEDPRRGCDKILSELSKKFHFFRHSPLYNYKFYFYIWAVLAGIAQLVEHDLAKVGVEGPSPFSRSKVKEPLSEWFFYFCVDMGRMFDPLGSRVRQNLAHARSAKRRILRLTRTQGAQARRVGKQPRSGD